MTRKDFTLIADTLKRSCPDRGNRYAPRATQVRGEAAYKAWREIVDRFAYDLRATNPGFKADLFRRACGVEE